MRKLAVIVALSLAILSVTLRTNAQDTREIDVFGGYSYLNVDTNGLTSRQSANGWEGSVSGDVNRWFAVEGDVSGYYKTYPIDTSTLGLGLGVVNVDVRDYAFVGGPRVNFGSVFVHALFGDDHLSGSALGGSVSQDGLAAVFGGGVQIPIAPQWAVRASADYAMTRHNIFKAVDPYLSNYTQNNFRVSAGIVFTFGRTRGARQTLSQSRPTGTEDAILFGISGYPGENGGVVVASVHSPSPAATAGIQPGDVIMTIDGQPVRDSRDIESAVGTSTSGTVRVLYFQHGLSQVEANVKVR